MKEKKETAPLCSVCGKPCTDDEKFYATREGGRTHAACFWGGEDVPAITPESILTMEKDRPSCPVCEAPTEPQNGKMVCTGWEEHEEEKEETPWSQFVARFPHCDALEDADDLQGALRGVAVHHDECSCDALLYIRQYADGHVTVEYPELKDTTSYADLEALRVAWEDEENMQAEQADKAKRRRARAYKCTCAHCGGFIGLEREAHCDTFGTCEGCRGEGADGFDVAELVLQGANPEPRNLDCMDARELFRESIREGTPRMYCAYAAMKREAVLKRLKGETQWAMDLEANADRLYKKIPAEWRW